LQGKVVASVDRVMRNRQPVIQPLAVALHQQRASNKRTADPRRGVTIMGDKSIPYKLLKKIMLTCASADYTNISLAVNQKPQDEAQAL
jgi:biopolymer transport protein ExbD